ncbi:hypothetical protein AAVH_39485 [Aphelenchoides avenae]|nr:hypothetical protein AAVH_39485 [Aphelenchus avenae]
MPIDDSSLCSLTSTASQTNRVVLQDHSECNRRVDDLQLQLKYKNIELQNEQKRVDLLSKTVKDLREAIPKKVTSTTSTQTTNANDFQDHEQCVQRLLELEARLSKQHTVRHVKQGIRQALEACPAEPSIVS